MFARGFLCFYRTPLLVSLQSSPKSNHPPRYAQLCRKSNVSPTYAKTGGVHPSKNVGAPTFALSFLPILTLGALSFQFFAHSFIFHNTSISRLCKRLRTLSEKTRGYTLGAVIPGFPNVS